MGAAVLCPRRSTAVLREHFFFWIFLVSFFSLMRCKFFEALQLNCFSSVAKSQDNCSKFPFFLQGQPALLPTGRRQQRVLLAVGTVAARGCRRCYRRQPELLSMAG